MKEESKDVGLKHNIQKTKIMASSPITSRQIDGETREAVRDFILWDSKITANDVCSLTLTPWKKNFDQPRQHLKSRDITLPTKVHRQSYGFSSSHVWMSELDYKES